MSYSVNLYKNSSDANYLNKALTFMATSECDFKMPIDVENPTIYIGASDDYDGVNYIQIPEFNRYYFAKCIGGTSQTLTFECVSDPLMSFKGAILASPAVIARNPWHYDKYIHDDRLPVEARSYRESRKFPTNTNIFNGTNNKYILMTIGNGGL